MTKPHARPAAVIRVVKRGFSNEISQSEYFPNCGLELRNFSKSDARNVVVTVTWVDARGHGLGAVRSDLALIPARQIFYMSCGQTDGLTVRVASLRVNVKVGRSTSSSGNLPIVSRLRLGREGCAEHLTPSKCGSGSLTGWITNRYTTRFSPDATIYAVFFDARGKIVGGESDDTTAASLKPGANVSFVFSGPGSPIASAKVSVDPCGVDAFIGQCRLR